MRKGYFKGVITDTAALIIGAIYAFLCILTRILSDSPYEALHRLNGCGAIPPMWILNLLSVLWCFLAGFAWGIVWREIRICRVRGAEEIRAYQGGLFFISLIFLSLIWYPLFFICERIFISMLVALGAAICATLASVLWKRVSFLPSLICAAYSFWLFYVFAVNLAVLLKN